MAKTRKKTATKKTGVPKRKQDIARVPKTKPPKPSPDAKPTNAQIGFHNICDAIQKARMLPMSMEDFQKWKAPVFVAINKQAEADRKG